MGVRVANFYKWHMKMEPTATDRNGKYHGVCNFPEVF